MGTELFLYKVTYLTPGQPEKTKYRIAEDESMALADATHDTEYRGKYQVEEIQPMTVSKPGSRYSAYDLPEEQEQATSEGHAGQGTPYPPDALDGVSPPPTGQPGVITK